MTPPGEDIAAVAKRVLERAEKNRSCTYAEGVACAREILSLQEENEGLRKANAEMAKKLSDDDAELRRLVGNPARGVTTGPVSRSEDGHGER